MALPGWGRVVYVHSTWSIILYKQVVSEYLSNGREVWGPEPGVLGQGGDGGGGSFGKAGSQRPGVPERLALNTGKAIGSHEKFQARE